MGFASNVIRLRNDYRADVVPPSLINQDDILYQFFPNLSPLERFILSTVRDLEHIERLDDEEYARHMSMTQADDAGHRYLEYLRQKENFEKRKLEESKVKKLARFRNV